MRIGEFEYSKRGISRFDWRDPYHFAVSISWPMFFMTFLLIGLVTHLCFATLYWLQAGSVAAAHGFLDDFFFSIETLATVGYGVFAPATTYGHFVSSIEIYAGMTQTAVVTGLIFVRFSRPKGKIIFADKAVISTIGGVPNLMIRLGNAGLSSLTAAEAGVNIIRLNAAPGALIAREMLDLTLIRTKMPIFPLIWVLRHPIDEKSPLFGLAAADLVSGEIRVLANCSAFDQSLGARVYGMRNYAPTEILFGHRYLDVVDIDGSGRANADYSRLHLVEAEAG